jgi:para-nitrobenzyl esterase
MHSTEQLYFFAWPLVAPLVGPRVTLSNQMQGYWTSFASTGNPDAAGRPLWPSWVPAQHQTLVLQTDPAGGNTVSADVGADFNCAFWASLGYGLP